MSFMTFLHSADDIASVKKKEEKKRRDSSKIREKPWPMELCGHLSVNITVLILI